MSDSMGDVQKGNIRKLRARFPGRFEEATAAADRDVATEQAEVGSAIPTLVVLESPYAGDVDGNVEYLHRCMRDSLARGEYPYASHGLYPGALDDDDPEQRKLGITAGFAWGALATKRVFYMDRGWSGGMQAGLEEAERRGQVVEYRHLDDGVEPELGYTRDSARNAQAAP